MPVHVSNARARADGTACARWQSHVRPGRGDGGRPRQRQKAGRNDHSHGRKLRPAVNRAIAEKLADYLASVNLSRQSTHDFEPKISPRPTGRATRVIITEYDLPRKEIQPHDVIVDPTGTVWFSHFGEQFLSKLDPNTGKVTDFPIPVQKLNHPKGTLDLEIDADGFLWVGLMYQTGMARFDRTTETFKIFPVPDEW